MQTVILIEEDNHGVIGVAKDYPSAIDCLVNENWLDENFEFYDGNYGTTKTILEDLGKEWKSIILSWDTEKFNEYFDCLFYLKIEGVYGTE